MPGKRSKPSSSLSSSSSTTSPIRPAALSRSFVSGESKSPSFSRPSLLAGLPNLSSSAAGEDEYESSSVVPPHPRRLWKVSDTALRQIPAFYPPLDPHCTCFVVDPASVVAVRIAECLRVRSVSVEYDEESCTASALTVDRCRFAIHLWQGRRASQLPSSPEDLSVRPDFSHGVVVECVRTSGSPLSFHLAASAVLRAACSQDSGKETREAHQASPLEFPRMGRPCGRQSQLQPPTKKAATLSTETLESLEHALQLLRKDRVCAQLLGMESLVALTDAASSGPDRAFYTALAVLGAPVSDDGHDVACLAEIHERWILDLLAKRRLPGDEDTAFAEASSHRSCATSLFGDSSEKAQQGDSSERVGVFGGGASRDENHGGNMRAMALRALSNSLTILSEMQPAILESVLSVQSPQLVSRTLLETLKEDLRGATRPPAVVTGTCLASQHEAALAVRCLRILGKHSDRARGTIMHKDDAFLALLDKARHVGKSTHEILAEEAKLAYQHLTVEERSC